MIKNYLKVALRSLQKNKLVSFINIFGLGLSMTIGMMVMIRLQDAMSVDKFHPLGNRVYRITSEYHKRTGETWLLASTPLPLPEKIRHDFSSAANVVNIYPAFAGKATAAGKEIYLSGAFTSSSFFDVFGFSLAMGDPATALEKPYSIVISKTISEKFFGADNALGKVFRLETGENFLVTGVLNEPPGKSHLNYEVYVSYSSAAGMAKNQDWQKAASDWYAFNAGYTYVLLKNNTPVSRLDQELRSAAAGINRNNKEGVAAFHSQSLLNISPGDERLYKDTAASSWTKFYFEIGVAFIILLAACFNYTNLTTARALTRAKEVGIRKVTGAKRNQIFLQYIIESVLLSFLALAFAWVLLAFIVQYAPFNDDYEFIPSSFRYNMPMLIWTLVFALFTGLLAGTAPAWILSSFKPVRVLKNLSTAKIFGKISIQKTLIVFQYSLSLTIIIFLFSFYRQFSFMNAAGPGFKKDNVLVVPLEGRDEQVAVTEIGSISGIQSVSVSSARFGKHFNGMRSPVWISNKADALPLNYYYADAGFLPSMQINVVAGENFPPGKAPDQEKYILLNQTAARALGFSNYTKAVGQTLWINDSSKLVIRGIVKDFHYENAGRPIDPLAFRNKKDAGNYLYMSVAGTDRTALLNRLQERLTHTGTATAINYSWLDDEWDRYNSQTATISLLGYIAFMAIAIATLGLMGLVIYTVEVKRKEISIRKVLGAGKTEIVRLLSNRFIKLLFIAGLIAVPLGYLAGQLFLQNFANRANTGIGAALGCFVLLLLIGLCTIVSQTYHAAAANPVKDMRME